MAGIYTKKLGKKPFAFPFLFALSVALVSLLPLQSFSDISDIAKAPAKKDSASTSKQLCVDEISRFVEEWETRLMSEKNKPHETVRVITRESPWYYFFFRSFTVEEITYHLGKPAITFTYQFNNTAEARLASIALIAPVLKTNSAGEVSTEEVFVITYEKDDRLDCQDNFNRAVDFFEADLTSHFSRLLENNGIPRSELLEKETFYP